MSRGWVRLTVADTEAASAYDMLVRECDVLQVRSAHSHKDSPAMVQVEQKQHNLLYQSEANWLTVTQTVSQVHERLLDARA